MSNPDPAPPSAGSAARILLAATRGQPMPTRMRALLRLVVSPLADLPGRVPRGARVFDVGCGTGAFLALVARTRAPAALYGSDTDPAAVQSAAAVLARYGAAGPGHIFLTPDPTETGVLPDCDLVTLIDVLHHIPPADQLRFLQRITDAMPPGAMLLLKEIDRAHAIGAAANRIHDRVFSGEAGHERPAAILEEWLVRCGMRIESRHDEWRLWYPHVTFLARKPDVEAG